jgi:hypothetical protein
MILIRAIFACIHGRHELVDQLLSRQEACMKFRNLAVAVAAFATLAAPVAAQTGMIDLGRTVSAISDPNAQEGKGLSGSTLLVAGAVVAAITGALILADNKKDKPSSP